MQRLSIDVIGIEEFHNTLLDEAKREKSKYDPKAIDEEVKKILNELKEKGAEIVKADDKEIIKVKLKNSTSFIIVYPPFYKIKAVEAMNDLEKISSILENSYNLLVFYSKKGKLTTSAYLYLGNVMEENELGILFINGNTKEIIEVFNILEKNGSYTPEEENFINID